MYQFCHLQSQLDLKVIAFSETKYGKHPNKSLWKKATKLFSKKKWNKSMKIFDKLFEHHPIYYSTCIRNYAYISLKIICKLLSQFIVKQTKQIIYVEQCDPAWPMFQGCPIQPTEQFNTHKLKPELYKSVDSIYKKWIFHVKQSRLSRAYNIEGGYNYARYLASAITHYSCFLRNFSTNYVKTIRYTLKMRNIDPWFLPTYTAAISYAVYTGKLQIALKIIYLINKQFNGNQYHQFESTSYIYITYFHCYVLLRLEKYNHAIKKWNQLEQQFNFDVIEKALCPAWYESERGRQSLPFYMGRMLPNTSIFDLKIGCYIGLQQFNTAQKICDFYADLWGDLDDQVAYYQAYLNLFCGKVTEATNTFRLRPDVWQQNQHYFKGLYHFAILKECEHAKYHMVASILNLHEKFTPRVAEYYLLLAEILMVNQEYKLAKYYLCRAFRITPQIPSVQKKYAVKKQWLNDKLKNIKCANVGCNKPYNYYCKQSMKMKKLSVCKGCGSRYFCSKKCQRLDWNWNGNGHRETCNKSWTNLFKMIKKNEYIPCPYKYCKD